MYKVSRLKVNVIDSWYLPLISSHDRSMEWGGRTDPSVACWEVGEGGREGGDI